MTSRILHISADFPDPIAPLKTPVIKSFLDLTQDSFEHEVVSINRMNPSLAELGSLVLAPSPQTPFIRGEQSFDAGVALEYAAPGRGIFHRTMLERLGQHIAHKATEQDKPFDLLVGHKLTIEGIAVARASEITGIPYALTIQGNSDRKIMKARPDLRGLFRSIYKNARMVCTFTPVARDAIENLLGNRRDGIAVIPCPTELDTIVEPKFTGGDLISVFHLKNYKVKNLDGLANATNRLKGKLGDKQVTILGGGDKSELLHCQHVCSKAQQIHFAGPVERHEMQARMNDACALIVPSRAESFGLVFVEALFAGLPIIYPKGTAIDGYFDGLPFAQSVDVSSTCAISRAMKRAVVEEREMKQALSEWQKSEAADKFTRKTIALNYTLALQSALTSR